MVIKRTKWSYLEPFLASRDFLHLADISRKLKEPHPTVRKYLKLFEDEGILVKDIKGRLSMYKLNLNHFLIAEYLVIAEKEKLINRCKENIILSETISMVNKANSKETVIFGSAAESDKFEDIDIITTGEIQKKEIEKKINKKVHLIKVKNLDDINEGLKNEVFKKHLIISGSEETVKWLL